MTCARPRQGLAEQAASERAVGKRLFAGASRLPPSPTRRRPRWPRSCVDAPPSPAALAAGEPNATLLCRTKGLHHDNVVVEWATVKQRFPHPRVNLGLRKLLCFGSPFNRTFVSFRDPTRFSTTGFPMLCLSFVESQPSARDPGSREKTRRSHVRNWGLEVLESYAEFRILQIVDLEQGLGQDTRGLGRDAARARAPRSFSPEAPLRGPSDRAGPARGPGPEQDPVARKRGVRISAGLTRLGRLRVPFRRRCTGGGGPQ